MTSEEAWQKQVKTIEHYREHQPEMLKHAARRSEAEINDEIGIGNLPADRPRGYLRLYPQDFIVEEKMVDGRVIKVNEILPANPERGERDNTLYANLIKIGIPTNVAIERIAQALDFDINKIGFAGLKDADAITAQLIALSGGKINAADIEAKTIANLLLTDLRYSTHSLAPGDLSGNVFTITIRTEKPLDDMLLKIKTEAIEKYGVLNYFQSQRFGGLRLISHKLGKLILQGNYELAIRYFLFKSGPDDIPLVAKLRKEAEKSYPDWKKIETAFLELPYTFSNELKAVCYLSDNKANYIGALLEIKDQTQLWLYAYSSFLFNKYLTVYSRQHGAVEESFPIFLSDDPTDAKPYHTHLDEDKTISWQKNIQPFKFVQPKKRLVAGRLWPKNLNYRPFDHGVILNFFLDKSATAGSILTNLFETYQGLPIPDWVNTVEIDPKEILGQGSLNNVKEVLKNYFYSKLDLKL